MPNPRAIKFQGTGQPFSEMDMHSAIRILGMDPLTDMPRLWAVLIVESRGFGFLTDRRPKILFERHVFYKQTNGQFANSYPTLCSKTAGGYSGGVEEYVRLEEALNLCTSNGLDEELALRSASWGLGQVMGFNAESAGFTSSRDMATMMAKSESSQLAAMVQFIQYNGLDKYLRDGKWEDFARRYNGPNYSKNEYDIKLKATFEKFSSGTTRDLRARAAQAALLFLGHKPGDPDGVFGQNTGDAIQRFRAASNMGTSRELDDAVFKAIMADAKLQWQ